MRDKKDYLNEIANSSINMNGDYSKYECAKQVAANLLLAKDVLMEEMEEHYERLLKEKDETIILLRDNNMKLMELLSNNKQYKEFRLDD